MKVDRLIEIERKLLPQMDSDIHAMKKQKMGLENEATELRKQLLTQVPKDVNIVIWRSSDPNVVVEGRGKERAVTILDVSDDR